jgi:hypothetical protein
MRRLLGNILDGRMPGETACAAPGVVAKLKEQ